MQAEALLKHCHGKPFPNFFLLLLPVSFVLTVLLNTPPRTPSASHTSHTWVCLPSWGALYHTKALTVMVPRASFALKDY